MAPCPIPAGTLLNTILAGRMMQQGVGIPAALGGLAVEGSGNLDTALPDGSFTPPAGPLVPGVLLYPDEVDPAPAAHGRDQREHRNRLVRERGRSRRHERDLRRHGNGGLHDRRHHVDHRVPVGRPLLGRRRSPVGHRLRDRRRRDHPGLQRGHGHRHPATQLRGGALHAERPELRGGRDDRRASCRIPGCCSCRTCSVAPPPPVPRLPLVEATSRPRRRPARSRGSGGRRRGGPGDGPGASENLPRWTARRRLC